MIPMTLPEIAAVTGGTVHDDSGVVVSGPAFVDSRVAEVDGLFVALAGARADGHEHSEEAVAAGGAAVLGSRPVGVPAVVVEDPVAALGRLARHVLDHLDHVDVVAITGSQGKTSAKDLLERVLSTAGPTVATFGSFNNELGLPLTVLRASVQTRYLVLEMGARARGDLSYLCSVAPPDVSLVLNVGKAHLGEFGSQAGIAEAKGEIVAALRPEGVAVLNGDDPLVEAMAERTAAAVVHFGKRADADVRIDAVTLGEDGCPGFDLTADGTTVHVQLRLLGEHQVHNAAAVAAVARALGLPLDQVADTLGRVTSTSKWRMETHQRADGVTVVNDAYNANPDSVRAALKILAEMGRARGGRTVAVLGEMLELGEASREEHDMIGRLAVRLDIDQLVVVGEGARPMHLAACLEGSWDGESVFVEDAEQAADWLRTHLDGGEVVLVKASRAAALEHVAAAVLGENEEDGR